MYKKISDYGVIGDMHSIALISRDGSIDYCSMPHIDSPTVFASLLDDEKGGFFRIQPEGDFVSKQEYVKDTNILRCLFDTDGAKAELIDFMPVETDELVDLHENIIHRCLRVISGRMAFVLEFYPRPNYARRVPIIERQADLFKVGFKSEKFTLRIRVPAYEVTEYKKGAVIIHFSLGEDENAHFDLVYGDKKIDEERLCSFEATHKFWVDWLHTCVAGRYLFFNEYTDMVNRSVLALKLLTFQPTGAISAAATTSLPESLGSGRNWDYRFTWLRDASFTLKSMFSLGHITEADSFIRWLHGIYQRYGSRNLQIMYSLKGERELGEKVLGHLKGYKDSKPVRIGNNAYKQNQWDIYGEVMDTALRLSDYAGKIDEDLWPFFSDICKLAAKNWRRPDEGIWEMQNGPAHFVYSKVMCWVALDRGIKIAKRYGFSAPLERWQKEKEMIKKDVLEKGYDEQIRSFVQRYGSKDLDSSLLLLALVNFLPIDDIHIQTTVEMCRKDLMKDGLLLRYRSADGLEGEEAAFLLCNFWLIEALVLSGKMDEARSLLSTTERAANHLGLFSEEYDFKNNEMLGNLPQAFSHIGYINAVSAIVNAQYRKVEDRTRAKFVTRMKKLVPFKIILNRAQREDSVAPSDIASLLKIELNKLQGAFFNTSEGRVDYQAMKSSESYRHYVELSKQLRGFNLKSFRADNERKAFWINLYNILIIHGVIELEIEGSVKEVFHFFSRIGYNVGGIDLSADDIEHGILRGNRPRPGGLLGAAFTRFDKRHSLSLRTLDPRIHFGLVCASSSCPPIEFYDSDHIDEQLDVAGRSFINRRGLMFDKANDTLYLSQIFKWYASDFGRTTEEVIRYALRFADKSLRNGVSAHLDGIRISYLPYDWNLNKTLE